MFTIIDFIAFSWLVFCWFGYSFLVDRGVTRFTNVHKKMYHFRLEWMKNALSREDKAVDAATLGNLMRAISFFASTSILIIAALIPMITNGAKTSKLIESIPYTVSNTTPVWEIKTLLLIFIFIYAFFKYTWALRQYNYASIMILATSIKSSQEKQNQAAKRNAKILSNAARHFSKGIRSYYFGIASLSWYFNPYLFIILVTLIILVLFRREFMSKALDIISTPN